MKKIISSVKKYISLAKKYINKHTPKLHSQPIDGVCQCGCDKTIKQINIEFQEQSEKDDQALIEHFLTVIATSCFVAVLFMILF